MRDHGLVEVLDASARFVGEATRAPGSVVLCAMEGSRPLLVEVQALVSQSELVPPRRVVDRARPQPAGAGAGRPRPARRDRARSQPTCSSTSSAACGSTSRAPTWPRPRRRQRGARVALTAHGGERPLACFGELGLTGELRSVGHPDRRMAEAQKFGLAPVIAPEDHRRCARRCGPLTAALGDAPAGGRRPHSARTWVRSARTESASRTVVKSGWMASRSGEELKDELESRRSPGSSGRSRWSRPGPRSREGLDNILHAHTGGLIVDR